MAEIVKSLFGFSPQDLQNARRQEQLDFTNTLARSGRTPQEVAGLMIGANLGQALGGGAARLFGIKDPQMERATQLDSILQQVQSSIQDPQNPEEFYTKLYEGLNSAGFSREAAEVLSKGQQDIAKYRTELRQADLATKQGTLYEAQAQRALRDNSNQNLPAVARLIEKRQEAEDAGDLDAIAVYDDAIAKANYIKPVATKEPSSINALATQYLRKLDDQALTETERQDLLTKFDNLVPLLKGKATSKGGVITVTGGKSTGKLGEDLVLRAADGSITDYKNQLGIVDDLLKEGTLNSMTTGIGGTLATKIHLPDAVKVNTALSTLRAGAAFTKIQELKNQSATGATGLGPVAVKEFEALERSVTALENSLSAKDLKENLKTYRRHLTNSMNYVYEYLPKKVENAIYNPKFVTTAASNYKDPKDKKMALSFKAGFLENLVKKDPEFANRPDSGSRLNALIYKNEKDLVWSSKDGKLYDRAKYPNMTDEQWADFKTLNEME